VTELFLLLFSRNAVDHHGEERYWRLHAANQTFSQHVWQNAQEFMKTTGWVEVDIDVVLPSDGLL